MNIVTLMVVLGILLVGGSFALLNAEAVQVHYYFGETQLPLSLGFLLAMLLGWLIGLLSLFVPLMKEKLKCRRLHKQLETVNAQLSKQSSAD